ncbi:NAD(P)-dependent dehydrogenase (short-subunit alcohol dehydrogenase family) [Naumannella cuiyingiana]|uniref:NAD(P)-dependent dehydrogenase (Short-subunit alcohol dehydrogenase family) n=1 Tax=Naumannella cuiyingiana TaxID=1347891 RepID=A0A7Z0DAT1_9ACTN|nr:SDR family NAD(P)-dependent oxidoreductase [Naumannella cuiyingiana]NYI72053.1 NAD(P)-dependent dehydrogenase (short-subunit alcohol dehydrogenase family) [Naumannella cuiyingiana]
MTQQVWLITGANAGFGRAIAEAARAAGDLVVATARDVSSLRDFDEPLTLDVTDASSVDKAVRAALHRHGRIDVLVNNAGRGLIGALEECTDDELRDLLEVNLLGALRTTRAVLPAMRRQRSGHIFAMSSVGGRVANPGHAAYATSKFALEGMSEALAGEVAPWGIRVTIIEPGPFRTEFAGRSMAYTTPIPDYADTPAGRLRERFTDQDGRQPNDPARAAEFIVGLTRTDPAPLRVPLGPEALSRIEAAMGRDLETLAAYREQAADMRFAD